MRQRNSPVSTSPGRGRHRSRRCIRCERDVWGRRGW